MSYVWSTKALASKFATPGAVANVNSKTIMLPNGKTIPRPTTMSQVPKIRELPADQALFIARQQPHIISVPRADEGGKFIGGPRNIKNTQQLNKQRGKMDVEIDAGAAGGDWYDRYRNAISSVTNNSSDADWMSAIQGMFSAGVSPESEFGFAIKSTNSAIATGGNPATMTKVARPAQKKTSIDAINANNPLQHQLGEKTGEYAQKVNPSAAGNTGVTGVNDFRHARTIGYTEADGSPQRGALADTGHMYSDYETALSVDRANLRLLDGRSNWNGEQIQAAPWVKQKGDDFFERQKTGYLKKARARLKDQGVTEVTDEYVDRIGRQISFEEASRTIGDYYPKHTAFATYEAQPYAGIDHLPGLQTASKAEQDEFARMPESSWANAPGGRDDIYSNTRLGNTGYVMKTLPTQEMQGVYTPPGMPPETNLGFVARPLVGFDTASAKTTPAHDQAALTSGEAIRAFIDTQGAAASHKPWTGTKQQAPFSNSVFASTGAPGPTPIADFGILGEIGRRRNLPDLVDTGQGVTLTNFDNPLTMADEVKYGAVDDAFIKKNNKILNKAGDLKLTAGEADDIARELGAVGYKNVDRVNVSADYVPMFENYEGYGKGAVTQNLLDILDSIPPGLYAAHNQNSAIPKKALANMARNQSLTKEYGAVSGDVQNSLKIVGGQGDGAGWIDRLRQGLKDGLILPSIGAFSLGAAFPQGFPDAE